MKKKSKLSEKDKKSWEDFLKNYPNIQDKEVKAMLVNIYAGINRCDWIAEGIVKAVSSMSLSVPLIVRLSGTNVEKGKEILSKSDLQIISADDLDDAAEKIVKAVKG